MNIAKSFYSGTSGLVLPVPQRLYPADFQGSSRLEYYASLFNSVEINSSFYKNPKVSTVLKWAQLTPEEFRFTFKLSKSISHAKQLAFKTEEVEAFMQTINAASGKKGCLLVQLPPALKVERIAELQRLLEHLKTANIPGWKIAIEFRHNSWYHQQVYDLLDRFDAAIVIHDIPASATPVIETGASFKYLRFHGENGRYRGSYPDNILQEYAARISSWLENGQTVYCYFNNTMGDAVFNLQALNKFVQLYKK
jgi:uncharacterized protein YecE (DUF72 family)